MNPCKKPLKRKRTKWEAKINSHLHSGVHGNAGAVASLPQQVASGRGLPEQLLAHASLWELEQHFKEHGLDPTAAYDDRALQMPFEETTNTWIASAADALALCIVNGTAFLDIDAVVVDGSFSRAMLTRLIDHTEAALAHYDWEGLWPATLVAGSIGSDARALGGAMFLSGAVIMAYNLWRTCSGGKPVVADIPMPAMAH